MLRVFCLDKFNEGGIQLARCWVMLGDFRSYQLAVKFHKACIRVKCSRYLHDQLLRATASVALNLAEGSERSSAADQRRFYNMALASVRECQAILDLLGYESGELREMANNLGGAIFNLCKSGSPKSRQVAAPRDLSETPDPAKI